MTIQRTLHSFLHTRGKLIVYYMEMVPSVWYCLLKTKSTVFIYYSMYYICKLISIDCEISKWSTFLSISLSAGATSRIRIFYLNIFIIKCRYGVLKWINPTLVSVGIRTVNQLAVSSIYRTSGFRTALHDLTLN